MLQWLLGKASSKGSIKSKQSESMHSFWETKSMVRWPINGSLPSLRIMCWTQDWASKPEFSVPKIEGETIIKIQERKQKNL